MENCSFFFSPVKFLISAYSWSLFVNRKIEVVTHFIIERFGLGRTKNEYMRVDSALLDTRMETLAWKVKYCPRIP